MLFKVGDKVHFKHEKGEGTIIGITSPYKIKVELTEGLDIEVHASELVPVNSQSMEDVIAEPKEAVIKRPKKHHSKPHASHELEVDLHIECLTEHSYNMSNAQKLNMQLDHFQDNMERAIKSHIKKVVFIHGVGNGVLRQSIRDILKRYEGVEYSDGPYRKYGAGATEVRILSRTKARQ